MDKSATAVKQTEAPHSHRSNAMTLPLRIPLTGKLPILSRHSAERHPFQRGNAWTSVLFPGHADTAKSAENKPTGLPRCRNPQRLHECALYAWTSQGRRAARCRSRPRHVHLPALPPMIPGRNSMDFSPESTGLVPRDPGRNEHNQLRSLLALSAQAGRLLLVSWTLKQRFLRQ